MDKESGILTRKVRSPFYEGDTGGEFQDVLRTSKSFTLKKMIDKKLHTILSSISVIVSIIAVSAADVPSVDC